MKWKDIVNDMLIMLLGVIYGIQGYFWHKYDLPIWQLLLSIIVPLAIIDITYHRINKKKQKKNKTKKQVYTFDNKVVEIDE